MPRRTKLIIAAIFLVLLVIPLGYVVLTWSPREPLRFRVTAGHKPRSSDYLTSLGVTVENTSAATIYLYGAQVSMPEGKGSETLSNQAGVLHPMDYPQRQAMRTGRTVMRIPAYSTIHATAYVQHARIEDGKAGRLRMRYEWMSVTRHSVSTVRFWLQDRGFQWLSSQVPVPSEDFGVAPLEAAEPQPGPASTR